MNSYNNILIILIILISFSCKTGTGGKNQTPSGLKIITHNVWYGFTKAPERKIPWLAWIKEQDPDVVSLQELNEYTPQMLADDARSYGHIYSVLLKEEGFPTGITSRYPIEEVKKTTDGFHHGLIRVRIQQIYYYVVHLHPSNWEFRNAEINKILQDVESLPPGTEVILAGDFNTFSPVDSLFYSHGRLEPFFKDRDEQFSETNLNQGTLDYSVIQKVLDFGFIDLEASLRKPSYGFSGSFPTLVEKEGMHGDQRRLDYIFASENLSHKVIRAEIIVNDTTLHLSDHLPVITELSFIPEK